ncbi:hypothetical protein, partial [Frankia sp. AvcI1]
GERPTSNTDRVFQAVMRPGPPGARSA